MPKLNLDIFSPTESEQEKAREAPAEVPAHNLGTESPIHSVRKGPSPKFVPVGFYPKHLILLDDAVLKLRRKGHWKASKSAIIRNLIEAHAKELDKFGRQDG